MIRNLAEFKADKQNSRVSASLYVFACNIYHQRILLKLVFKELCLLGLKDLCKLRKIIKTNSYFSGPRKIFGNKTNLSCWFNFKRQAFRLINI